jgi:flagellar biosynthesis protein FlhA
MKGINLEALVNKENMLSALGDPKRHQDIAFAIGIIGIISVLIFPIPPWLVDFLLSISITLSVLILMTVLFIDKPLDFSAFPTVLLVVTMLRLALNITTTRLILSKGHSGPSAAGHVIEAFGSFVMQGSVVIGIIVFGILTIINFVVITKGSGRIAEVAARFSLDAMPGKQMAIDADLSAGLIDEATARERRKNLEDENTFFGAMDGANKFVRGDAIAGILITFINLIGGILIGMLQMGLNFSQAIHTYTFLTIGDGLVSQIPALIVSTSAGLLVTKSGTTGSAEKAIFEQVGKHPQSMGVTSGLLLFMAGMPGIPAVPFAIASSIMGVTAYFLYHNKKAAEEIDKTDIITEDGRTAEESEEGSEEQIEKSMQIDAIKLELGYELLSLLNYEKGHKLTDQIKGLRKQIAMDLGFILPSVRIQDNLQLQAEDYSIRIKDIECGVGTIRPSKILAMDPRGGEVSLPGEDTREPAFNLKAKWIDESRKEEALLKEYTVVDPPTVIITHLTELVKENIPELFTYSETQKLLEKLSEQHRKLIAEIVPSEINVTIIQRVLQELLSENVSIRDLATIVEAIAEICKTSKSIPKLIEHVRVRLSKQICASTANEQGYVPILVLSPEWEQIFVESLVGEGEERQLALAPTQLQEFVAAVNTRFEDPKIASELPVILTPPQLRSYIRAIIERFRASIVVLSQNEIHPKAKIKTIGQI